MRKYTFTEKGHTFKWNNTIIAICSKPQPRTASTVPALTTPPAGGRISASGEAEYIWMSVSEWGYENVFRKYRDR